MNRIMNLQNCFVPQKHQIHQDIKPHLKQVYDRYLHSFETRKPQQIKATVDQVYKLTQQNLNRLNSKSFESLVLDNQRFKNCIFICLHGIPAFKNQFSFLKLPGKVYEIVSNGFQMDKDQAYRQKNIPNCRFGKNAEKIHEVVSSNPSKDIIFIYHSFGTYNLSVYFQKYGVERVKGLIQIGAAPIRQYLYITEMVNYCFGFTEEDLIRNTNDVAGEGLKKLMDRVNKELNVKWEYFPSVSYAASFLSHFKSAECPILFDLNRRYPNMLKLMIFGEEDHVFEQELIAERAIFYTGQKLQNGPSVKQNYEKRYSTKVSNLQQNFIFMIPKGKHSVHLQKKNQPLIQKAVHQYLDLILA